MFWVVQNDIFGERNHSTLVKTLKEKKIPYVEVKVVPFFEKLLPARFDSHGYRLPIDEIEEAFIDESGLVMASGSLTLAKIAKSRGWEPGSFLNDNFHFEKWKKAYGENLLNFESVVDSFEEISPPWDTFFIRPCEDTKDFNGTVFEKNEFLKWRTKQLEGMCPFSKSAVVASPAKNVKAEYRFFTVDGKVVSQSRYRLDGKLSLSADVLEDVAMFAQKMIDRWQPSRAFVIDIAETDEGLRIVEINNINSAGFYEANIEKIVEAIESMKF